MTNWKKAAVAAVWTLGLGYASPVLADCETNDDCGAGKICMTYEYQAPTCDKDIGDCEDGDEACLTEMKEMMEACDETETITESVCEPAPCDSDADCGDEMICIEYIDEWCSGSDIAVCDEDDDNCVVPEQQEPVCGTDIHKKCGYKYEAACEADDDCGEGFTCEAIEICSCSSSAVDTDMGEDIDMDGGVAAGEDMSGPDDAFIDPVEPECTCETTGETQCQMKEIECEADEDCPAGTLCDAVNDVNCMETPDGIVSCDDVTSVRYCRPEGHSLDNAGHTAKEDGDAQVPGDAGADTEAPATPNGDGEEGDGEEKDTDSPEGDGKDTPEVDGTDPEVISVDDDAVKDGDKDDSANADDDGASSASNGGCSVVTPAAGGSTAGALLGLLSLMGFAWRRR